ncbi:Putative ATP-dependent RNA helicase DDX41 [Fukomys damarensis]|uniref:Putative ATP-dependent RNA helicase DDX41 n=1 Tax=Fukomys damarensis TaxID=885580 RepID=A0A091CZY7_FUKDA|nr:Putative ATP-dependent RNA helicase DDX41 [Fukomys damarensis]
MGAETRKNGLNTTEVFQEGKKDVPVATGVASKGLNFPAIQRVISYNMSEETEDYAHWIGRAGQSGHSGVATTCISKLYDELVLMGLKAESSILRTSATTSASHFCGYVTKQSTVDPRVMTSLIYKQLGLG